MFEGDKNKKMKTKTIDGIEYTEDQYHGWRTCNEKGQLHSYNDKPAIIYSNGAKHWYKNGKIHRDNDKPAVICADGTKQWYRNGKYHRDNDKPATIYYDGAKEWYKNGLRHRDNDKPAVIWSDGMKEWWVNGKLQPSKYFTCFYVKDNKQHKLFFETESLAKQYESDMLAKNICAWVIENT